jgi:hypothetical protein
MISFSRYINIISGVGAGAAVAQRQLIMRIVTQNAALPPGVVAEFTTASAVGAYFGQNSEEYARAAAYFSFVSKIITSPGRISYSRWVNAPIAPLIVGDTTTKAIGSWSGITAGTLTINSGANVIQITGINTSSASSLTAVATALQAAIRTSSDPQLTSASVTYNTNTNQFVLSGSVAGSGSLSVTPTGAATDVSQLLGWGTSGSTNVPGQSADTPDVAISKSAAISNNFGSFVFASPASPLTNTQIQAIAAWNAAQNNMFIYSVPVPQSNWTTLYGLVGGLAGCCLNGLSTSLANDYPEQSPCEILAATDYTRTNATQNYMYYQFGNRNVVVSDDTTANLADNNRINYIGVTQNAGQQLAFYQRGVMCGTSTNPTDINTYANEQWLKSYLSAQLMQAFLASPKIPANDVGRGQVYAIIQTAIDLAKTNGTISAGKTLTTIQQQVITSLSGSLSAWRQVQTLGYWLNVTFSQISTTDGRTEYVANYLLIYSKDDVIRSVNGSDVLI